MADADENTIRTALTDQLTRCEARCARCEAELKSVTAAMQQSDAANVALAAKLQAAHAAVREECAVQCDALAAKADLVDECEALTFRTAAARIRSGES